MEVNKNRKNSTQQYFPAFFVSVFSCKISLMNFGFFLPRRSKQCFLNLFCKRFSPLQLLNSKRLNSNLLCIIRFAINLTFSKETWRLAVEGRKTHTASEARSVPWAASNFQQISVCYRVTASCACSELRLQRVKRLKNAINHIFENSISRLVWKRKGPGDCLLDVKYFRIVMREQVSLFKPFSFSPLAPFRLFDIHNFTFSAVICCSHKHRCSHETLTFFSELSDAERT